jgi:hypothetical protein
MVPPTAPKYLPGPDIKRMDDFISGIRSVITELRSDLFEPSDPTDEIVLDESAGHLFFYKDRAGSPDAVGRYEGGGFTVIKGSVASHLIAKSSASEWVRLVRQRMEEEGTIANGKFTKDVTFIDYAEASKVLEGCASPTKNKWRDKEGTPIR